MRNGLLRRAAVVGGAIALLLMASLAASEGRTARVLGDDEQAQVRGGALGYSCTGSVNCAVCFGPTCMSNGRGGCIINQAGLQGACSAAATVNVCKSDSIYYWCSNAATGLCGSSQIPNACPNTYPSCPAPNPGCNGGGNVGCGGC